MKKRIEKEKAYNISRSFEGQTTFEQRDLNNEQIMNVHLGVQKGNIW